MAIKASADRVAADMRPPGFRQAVQLIRHAIQKHKDKIASENKAIGEKWGQVEGHKVNRKAGRIFMTLDKLAHEERVDIMRDLNGLMDAAGWEEQAGDLVDQSEDNVVRLRFGGGDEPVENAQDGGEQDMQDLEKELAEPAPTGKPRRGKAAKAAEVSDEERDQQNVAAAKLAAKVRERTDALAKESAGPGYTGDNSDLAE